MVSSPTRTCAGCRRHRPQDELIRLARLADGSVTVDSTHRAGGRGAYVCSDVKCVAAALDSSRMRNALKCDHEVAQGLRGTLLETVSRAEGGA